MLLYIFSANKVCHCGIQNGTCNVRTSVLTDMLHAVFVTSEVFFRSNDAGFLIKIVYTIQYTNRNVCYIFISAFVYS